MPRQLSEIALALLGIWLAVEAVTEGAFIAQMLIELEEAPLGFSFFGSIAPLVIHAVLGAILIRFRRALAGALFPDDDHGTLDTLKITGDHRAFLIALLGVWTVVAAISRAAEVEGRLLLTPSSAEFDSLFGASKPRDMIRREAWIQRIPWLVQLATGCALFLSAGNLVDLWHRLRSAGRSPHAG